jgi:hypothetical protein
MLQETKSPTNSGEIIPYPIQPIRNISIDNGGDREPKKPSIGADTTDIYQYDTADTLKSQIISLKEAGHSYRQIADELGISVGKIQRTLAKGE